MYTQKNLICHETGHTIMHDSHQCDCPGNLMYSVAASQCGPPNYADKNHIDLMYLNRMHRTFAMKNIRNHLDCTSDYNGDYYTKTNAILNEPIYVRGNFIVKSGTTLTVNSEMFFNEKSKLIVETDAMLVVKDGGVLKPYSDCGNSTWEGIRVNGGSDTTEGHCDVKLEPGAIIEGTSGPAISLKPYMPGVPYQQIIQFGNGIVHAEGATFNNCRRMVEFISYVNADNSSYVRDCMQNNGKWGVTNWNCRGVEITGTEFNNITSLGLETVNGSFVVSGCTINSGEQDVVLTMTSPGFQETLVSESYLNGSSTNAVISGNPASEHRFVGNNFSANLVGLWASGDNQYLVENNTFNDFLPTYSNSIGSNQSKLKANQVNGGYAGNWLQGSHNNYLFVDNCYSVSGDTDIFLSSAILPQMMADENGDNAGNCFTHQGEDYNGNSSVATKDISGGWTNYLLTYITPEDREEDCKDLYNPDIIVNESGGNDLIDCGSELMLLGTGVINIYDNCRLPTDPDSLAVYIQTLQTEYDALQSGDTELPEVLSKRLERKYSICLRNAKKTLYSVSILAEDYEKARRVYSDESDLTEQMLVYGAYIRARDYGSAAQYLAQFDTRDQESRDFVLTQEINLVRLGSEIKYIPSQTELDLLHAISMKHTQVSAYAKGLYYFFTGELLLE